MSVTMYDAAAIGGELELAAELTYGELDTRIVLMDNLFREYVSIKAQHEPDHHDADMLASKLDFAEAYLADCIFSFKTAWPELTAATALSVDMTEEIRRYIEAVPRLCRFGKQLIEQGLLSPEGVDRQWVTAMTKGPSKNGWRTKDCC